MLTAVWGRTRLVNTRLEAVRKVMSTVVGLQRMAGEATSTYLAVAIAYSVGIVISGCGRTHSVAELMAVPTKEMEAAATPPANSCQPTSILSLGVDMLYF